MIIVVVVMEQAKKEALTKKAEIYKAQLAYEAQVACFNIDWKSAGHMEVHRFDSDEEFTAANDNNFVWVTFTRTNPSHDVYGVHATQEYKHWGCRGALVLDARIKQHHAPELVVDDAIRRRVDKRFSKGGDLYGVV